MILTMLTSTAHFEGLSLTNQQNKLLVHIQYILKSCLRLKLRVRVVVDYVDMRLSNFVIKYLSEIEKIAKPYYPLQVGTRFRVFWEKKKIEAENFVTLFHLRMYEYLLLGHKTKRPAPTADSRRLHQSGRIFSLHFKYLKKCPLLHHVWNGSPLSFYTKQF